MEERIAAFVGALSWPLLLALIAISFLMLAKGADWLVDEAVRLSLLWSIPKAVIGATIVSLGTTLPETVVSFVAAIEGQPDVALGNAVGSIVCNTGLVLGLAVVLAPVYADPFHAGRQLRFQNAACLLLILAAWPWNDPVNVFRLGGHVPRAIGFLFLSFLFAYLWHSMRIRQAPDVEVNAAAERFSSGRSLAKMALAVFMVAIASRLLVPSVGEFAIRIRIPQSVVAATLVAFGTSLPELVTTVTSALKGHGELGVGNVIGANTLNVLLVTGLAAAVSPGGLAVSPYFFRILFPALVVVLALLRYGILWGGNRVTRPFGFALLGVYVVASALGYAFSR